MAAYSAALKKRNRSLRLEEFRRRQFARVIRLGAVYDFSHYSLRHLRIFSHLVDEPAHRDTKMQRKSNVDI